MRRIITTALCLVALALASADQTQDSSKAADSKEDRSGTMKKDKRSYATAYGYPELTGLSVLPGPLQQPVQPWLPIPRAVIAQPHLIGPPPAAVITKQVHVAFPYPVERHVPVPHPVPFPVFRHVQVPVDRPVAVPVAVDRPVAVPVDRPVPYPVYRHVHVDRPVAVPVPVDRPVAVPVDRPVAVPVYRHIPVPVDRPVDRPFPVPVPVPQPLVPVGPVPQAPAGVNFGFPQVPVIVPNSAVPQKPDGLLPPPGGLGVPDGKSGALEQSFGPQRFPLDEESAGYDLSPPRQQLHHHRIISSHHHHLRPVVHQVRAEAW